MICNYLEAENIFESAFRSLGLPPSFHPYYIAADSRRDKKFEPVYFVYENNGKTFYHGFLVGSVPGTKYKDIQSPYGYGGPISTSKDVAFLSKAWAEYFNWCAENNVLAEFIRFHPLAENWACFKGELVLDRKTVWMDLSTPDLFDSYDVRARTAIRKALKEGLSVEWAEGPSQAASFKVLYCEAMARINADASYYFNEEYFERILKWDRSMLATCKRNGEIVAMAVFLAGDRIMEYHLSASAEAGRKYSATNLIIHEAASRAQRDGFIKLHLGGGTNSDSANSLLFFKSGFSKQQADFKLGKCVHNGEGYESLREEWLRVRGSIPEKFLFYRF